MIGFKRFIRTACFFLAIALLLVYGMTAFITSDDKVIASEKVRNENYVLQMPSDGLALGTVDKYSTKDASGNITAMNFPTDGSGNIDFDAINSDVETYLSNYFTGTNVGRAFFNVNYARSMVHSEVMDTQAYNVGLQEDGSIDKTQKEAITCPTDFPAVQYYWYTLQENIDIIDMAIDYANSNGVEAWASFRMNDHHYSWVDNINASFKTKYASTWGVNGGNLYVDYTLDVVQQTYLNYVKEVATNYDIYGVDLDFLRTAPYMTSVTPENILKLNSFVKSVKEAMIEIGEQKGRDIKVSARVFATEEINLSYGLDVAQWIADGAVDIVTVANFYQPVAFDLPIKEWRESIDARNVNGNDYVLLAGLDWAVKSNTNYYLAMTPAHTRGFVTSAYQNGADGIYLFNMFYLDGFFAEETVISADGTAKINNIFKERMMASDSLESAYSGLRRYTYGYYSTFEDAFPNLPKVVNSYNTTSFKVQTGLAPEQGYFMIAIGLDHNYAGYDQNNLAVTVNGKPLKQIGDMPRSNSFTYAQATSEIGIRHLTQTSKRLVQFVVTDLSIIKDGHNVINVINRSDKPQCITWLEVFVDNTMGSTPVA